MAQVIRKNTTFPPCYPIDRDRPWVQGTSPSRVWEQTAHDRWVSREWMPGERLHYIKTVLNRQPYSGEL